MSLGTTWSGGTVPSSGEIANFTADGTYFAPTSSVFSWQGIASNAGTLEINPGAGGNAYTIHLGTGGISGSENIDRLGANLTLDVGTNDQTWSVLLNNNQANVSGTATVTYTNPSQMWLRGDNSGFTGTWRADGSTIYPDNHGSWSGTAGATGQLLNNGAIRLSSGTLYARIRIELVGNGQLITTGNNTDDGSASTLQPGTGTQTGDIYGTGDLTITAVRNYGKVLLEGNISHLGDTVIENKSAGMTLQLGSASTYTFTIGANGLNEQIRGLNATNSILIAAGQCIIDTATADFTDGNSWTLVDVSSLDATFDASFNLVGFTQDANVWTLALPGWVWTFSEATGVLSLNVGPTEGNFSDDVFFMGGQSNADIEIALGIEDILRKSGHFKNPTVVWNNHPGNPVIDWHDGSVATKFFDEDLYDLDGIHDVDGSQVGILEQVMTTGTPKKFRAFFWWQGEADSYSSLYPLYEAKFMGMLNELETRLGQSIGTGENDWSFHFALPDIRTFAYDNIRNVQIGIVNDNSAVATYTDTRWLDRLWPFSNPHGAEYSGYFIGIEMANNFLLQKGFPAVNLSAAAGETLVMPDKNGLTSLSLRVNDKYSSVDCFLNRASTWPSHALPVADTILRFDDTLTSTKVYAPGGAFYNFANSPAGQEGTFQIGGIEYASPHEVTINPVSPRYYNSISFGSFGVDASAATSRFVINCDVETREPQVWVTAAGQAILFNGPAGTIADLDKSPIGGTPDGQTTARRYPRIDLKNASLTGGGTFDMRYGTFDLGSQANTAVITFGGSDITFADAQDGGIASPLGTATDLRNGWLRDCSFTYNGVNNAAWNRNIYFDTVAAGRNASFTVSQAGVTLSSTGSFGPIDTTDTLNLKLGGAGNLSISGSGGVLSNGSALCHLEKTGSGTLTLSSSGNSFNGALAITSGKLLVDAASSVNSCSDITIGSGSTTAILEYASSVGLNRAVTVNPGSTFIYSSQAPHTGALTVLPGAVVIVDGPLDVANLAIPTGARLVLRGNASLTAAMSLTVDGILDTFTWSGTLPASFVNNGLRLGRSDLELDSNTFTDSNATLKIHGYPGHGYQLQTSTTLLPDGWSFIGNSEDGTDALITFDGPIEPEDPGTFYRILVNP